jgi:hypothetical protein
MHSLKKLEKAGYKQKMIARIEHDGTVSYDNFPCILCGVGTNPGLRALYVNDTKKQVVAYGICNACFIKHGYNKENIEQFFREVAEPRLDELLANQEVP